VAENEVIGDLKPVLRLADRADFERMEMLYQRHDDVLSRCAEKVKDHQLPMDLVKAEYSFDGSRLTFYFTSDQRVDFRMLVRDLARTFKSRIELRQIGPRDEAKLLGGIGPCGRLLCCATFLPDYARVSIKMAKDQDLPLNPSKISGVCGRLLCCLSYEHQQYIDMKAELPARGSWVHTPDGPGDVVSLNVLRQTVTVRLASSGMEEEYTLAQVGQAADAVQTIAQSRNQEGITPAARQDYAADDAHGDEKEALRYLLDEDEDEEAAAAPPARRSRGPAQRKEPGSADSSRAAADASDEQQPTRKRSRRKRKPAASKETTAQANAPAEQQPQQPARQATSETPAQEPGERKKPRRRRKRKKPPQQAEE
jgi:cell fate regulator YaaT (PSP1 superfamily)